MFQGLRDTLPSPQPSKLLEQARAAIRTIQELLCKICKALLVKARVNFSDTFVSDLSIFSVAESQLEGRA